MTQPRIVSLIPSATEIVAALGYEQSLVGRSHECDFPATVKRLTVRSEPRIDVGGTSRQIDKAVLGAVREALSVYRVFVEELKRLQPTIIITQIQCDVCAVNLRDVEAAVCEIVDTKPRIVALAPMALPDILFQHDPDYLVVLPCGFNIKRTIDELHLLTDHPAWPHLNAVKNQRVFLTDGKQYFNRSGPRVVESAEILAEILSPHQTTSLHRGIGWQHLSFG